MKKKVSAAKRSASSVKKTAPKKSRASQSSVITYQRIIIFGAVVLALVGVFLFNSPSGTQSVAGISVAKGLFAQATVTLPDIRGAVAYNVYYKKVGESSYTNAVRKIPESASSYTISYLTKNAKYEYKMSAVDASGKEFWFSPTRPLENVTPM